MSLDQQRLAQLERQVQRGGDGRVAYVRLAIELLEELCDSIQGRLFRRKSDPQKACVRPGRQTSESGARVGIGDAAR
jgi:hypothetical protein